MNTYTFTAISTIVLRSDNANITWDTVHNQPADINGLTGRTWKADGSPIPSAYVAPAPTPEQSYDTALLSGVNVIWTISEALNGKYACDHSAQTNIMAERLSLLTNNQFTNKQVTRSWPFMTGGAVTFTIAQFDAFATAIAQYVDACALAYTTAVGGGTPTWPSNALSVAA